MSYGTETAFDARDMFAIDAAQSERAAFIRRTYMHLLGAVLALIGLEVFFLSTPAIYEPLFTLIAGHWWVALIAFMAASWIAQSWAQNGASPGLQYAGLALYTLAEAVILCPLLYIISRFGAPNIIPMAGLLTGVIFVGLTAIVFMTKADFSFLRGILWIGGLTAIGVALAGAIFGFSLGLAFVVPMIVLLSGYILYDTSNILHHYRTDQHVAASLALFASVATMFWYMLRLLSILSSRD
jgi:FtsH-binding integral membrane protein